MIKPENNPKTNFYFHRSQPVSRSSSFNNLDHDGNRSVTSGRSRDDYYDRGHSRDSRHRDPYHRDRDYTPRDHRDKKDRDSYYRSGECFFYFMLFLGFCLSIVLNQFLRDVI